MPDDSARLIAVTVPDGGAGERLDKLLAEASGLSRSRVQALIRAGRAGNAAGTIGDPGYRVKPGESLLLGVPAPVPATPRAQSMPLAVVFEDRHLIVIDKPAGLVVHPAAGHADGTLVNALIAYCGESLSGIGGVVRPGIVHRLDKDTSGLLVVAKTDAAHAGLSAQFAAHGRDGRLMRRYLAVVWRAPVRRAGTIDAPLGRSRQNRTRIAIRLGEAGREAVTHYTVRATYAGHDRRPVASQLDCRLETGRTHQIRVHMASIGHPLLGDAVYGAGHASGAARLPPAAAAALEALGRQALHAAGLGFEHPVTGKRLDLESAPPADLAALLEALAAA